MAAADDQDRGTQHHEWPDRVDFGLGQRAQRVVRAHRGQDVGRLGAGVVQDRGDRDRQLADGPRPGQVTEVDHPVDEAVRAEHGVVVGQVEVHDLDRQVGDERRDEVPGPRGSTFDLGPPICGQRRAERGDRPAGVPRVPLQDPVESVAAGDVRERQVDPGRDLAQPGDASRCQVTLVVQRAAGKEPDQPGHRRTVRSGDRRAPHGSVVRAEHLGDPQFRARGGDPVGGGVLGRDLGSTEGRVRHLEHRHRFPRRRPHEEVGVLVAAQLVRDGVDAERLVDDPSSPRLVDAGRRKGCGFEEIRHLSTHSGLRRAPAG